jgi:hypothetical protein
VRTDDKHLRSVEFELSRGRYRAIVTAKSRGDVTFVGPFRTGKTEGPARASRSTPATRSRALWRASSRASSKKPPPLAPAEDPS